MRLALIIPQSPCANRRGLSLIEVFFPKGFFITANQELINLCAGVYLTND